MMKIPLKIHECLRILVLVSVVIFSTDAYTQVEICHVGPDQTLLRVKKEGRYLLLPIEEQAGEARFLVQYDNETVQTLNIRLAVNKTDYYVPFDLSAYDAEALCIDVRAVSDNAVCWSQLRQTDEFDVRNTEKYRPAIHFTPAYGWMNDPNGMFYKDGEYHLYYQYNPYGAMWGNMHWGHAVSRNLTDWEHCPVAISPDGLGAIFSGSCVVDEENTSGFGAGAVVAFYTSAGERQFQSMAYSTDNGRSFKKYPGNPIVTSTARDFRDPKVFRHTQSGKWIMILAAGQEMQIYSSSDLKAWTYESSFGKGYGAHGGVWECPDLVELPVRGTDSTKWVLLCNLNPGGPFGGSATQYFVGQFDGKTFTCESAPETTRWMDWGKDHYATVTWSNAPEHRTIALGWMSNWEYANNVPTMQYRSANTLPRELFLYNHKGNTLLGCLPVAEVEALRGKCTRKGSFKVSGKRVLNQVIPAEGGAYEILLTIGNINAGKLYFSMYNSHEEEVNFCLDMSSRTFSMDRTKSGDVSFSPTFPAVTSAPLEDADEYTVRILVDKSSVEAFDVAGHYCMTNLVFPTDSYRSMAFYAEGGSYRVKSLHIYPLTNNE